jgi:outer membrane protein TolC
MFFFFGTPIKKEIRLMKRFFLLFTAVWMAISLTGQQKDLDYYIARAVENSPLLADYQNRIRSALIDSLRVRASQRLQLKAVSDDYYAPVYKGWGYDEVITDGTNVSAIVEISRDFMGKNNLSNRYRSIRLQNLSASLEGKITEQELRKNIIAQYITTFGSQQEYQLNNEILGILHEEEKWVKKLTSEGIYRQTEYLSLLVNLRQQEVMTAQAFNQCQVDLGTLNYMCGIYDTGYVVLSDPELIVNTLPDIRNSVFYQRYETDSLRLVTADKLIDFEYRPRLSVYANGGYFSSLAYTPWKNFGASAGLSLTIPIYDGGQKKMQHDQVAISQETGSGYRSFFVRQYRQQVAVLYKQLVANDKLIQQSAGQLNYARTLIEANQKLLNLGDVSVTDYLLAISNYLTAKRILIENQLSKYHIINEINYWSKVK